MRRRDRADHSVRILRRLDAAFAALAARNEVPDWGE
jgi:hypothetical protein